MYGTLYRLQQGSKSGSKSFCRKQKQKYFPPIRIRINATLYTQANLTWDSIIYILDLVFTCAVLGLEEAGFAHNRISAQHGDHRS